MASGWVTTSTLCHMVMSTPANVSPGFTFRMEAICRRSSAMPSMEKASSLMGTITSSAATSAARALRLNAGGMSMMAKS